MAKRNRTTGPRRAHEVRHWEREVDVVVVGSGSAGVSAAIESAESGAEIQTSTDAECLVVEDDGRVVGVVSRTKGVEQRVRARKGVVLTTGGFIRNEDMVHRHAPELLRCGRPIAAETSDDGSGQRYVNEDVYQSNHGELALFAQAGDVYLIVDDSIYVPSDPSPAYEGTSYDLLAVADTPEGLERELGMPRHSLSSTLAIYNENAAQGIDPLFHKASSWLRPLEKPPFAAIDLRVGRSLYSVFTLGGLRTSVDQAVLDADGEVVPGLYAAGRTASGIPAQGYNSGLSLADCTFSGRIAGAKAASVATI